MSVKLLNISTFFINYNNLMGILFCLVYNSRWTRGYMLKFWLVPDFKRIVFNNILSAFMFVISIILPYPPFEDGLTIYLRQSTKQQGS